MLCNNVFIKITFLQTERNAPYWWRRINNKLFYILWVFPCRVVILLTTICSQYIKYPDSQAGEDYSLFFYKITFLFKLLPVLKFVWNVTSFPIVIHTCRLCKIGALISDLNCIYNDAVQFQFCDKTFQFNIACFNIFNGFV